MKNITNLIINTITFHFPTMEIVDFNIFGSYQSSIRSLWLPIIEETQKLPNFRISVLFSMNLNYLLRVT